MKRINEETRVSILPVEQNTRSVLSLANHGCIMWNNRIALDDTGENLRQNAHVREFYMELGTVGETNSYREASLEKKQGVRLGNNRDSPISQ